MFGIGFWSMNYETCYTWFFFILLFINCFMFRLLLLTINVSSSIVDSRWSTLTVEDSLLGQH